MAANVSPTFPISALSGWWATLLAQTDTGTGVATDVVTLGTAGANGSVVANLKLCALGTNVASVLYLFQNNAGANTTAANNSLIMQIPLPPSTANAAGVMGDILVPVGIVLPATYKLMCALGTAVALGWQVTALGGNY
jgi:uncharacterized membrane protein YeaQ/YmgE (transglycosylase-associated protein family)